MVCPGCKRRFATRKNVTCPFCGHSVVSGVVKTSTILISSGRTDAVFRSVDEVPAPLKEELLRSTNGINAATIVIADRRGRKEIARAIRSLPALSQPDASPAPERARGSCLGASTLRWAGAALIAGLGLAVWLMLR